MKKIILWSSMVCMSTLALVAQETEAKLAELMAYESSQSKVLLDYDPFVTKVAMEALEKGVSVGVKEESSFILLSIMNQKAFISGRWYRVGEQTSGGKIISIGVSSVELLQNGKKRVLRFESAKNVLHVKDSSK